VVFIGVMDVLETKKARNETFRALGLYQIQGDIGL
jgi:hypothetical protein